MRTVHLLVVLSLLGMTACVDFPDIPEVYTIVTGPATLQVGASAQYVATITSVGSTVPTAPAGWSFRWYSSEPSVATVSDLGVVTGRLPGRTTIRATPYRGSKTGAQGTLVVDVTGCTPDACSW